MQNAVDTSQDTINAEFEAAAQAIGMEPDTPAHSPENDAQLAAEREAQIAIAQQMIATSFRLSLGLFSGVEIEHKHTDDAAHAYAVLVIKYFPGGIFGLLDRYKEEIAAGTATLMLVRVVGQAKAAQAAEEAAAKKPEDSVKPTTDTFNFTDTEKGELNNG
ncbi:MAG: hypothetical protein KTR20_14165 [Cellvibrionaceae bacterium]|nr:hypothetical protein [Cellvibrionaceae bacterium]